MRLSDCQCGPFYAQHLCSLIDIAFHAPGWAWRAVATRDQSLADPVAKCELVLLRQVKDWIDIAGMYYAKQRHRVHC